MDTLTKINSKGVLAGPQMTILILAVLIERLGGEVIITQEDIDKITYCRLLESWTLDNELKLQIVQPHISS